MLSEFMNSDHIKDYITSNDQVQNLVPCTGCSRKCRDSFVFWEHKHNLSYNAVVLVPQNNSGACIE